METLTDPDMFQAYQKFGHPDGSKTVNALHKAIPHFLFTEEFKPMLYTWGFVSSIALFLGLKVWWGSDSGSVHANGINVDSKASMQQFMVAILEDNPKSERIIGFSDVDMIEIYE